MGSSNDKHIFELNVIQPVICQYFLHTWPISLDSWEGSVVFSNKYFCFVKSSFHMNAIQTSELETHKRKWTFSLQVLTVQFSHCLNRGEKAFHYKITNILRVSNTYSAETQHKILGRHP